MRTSYPRNSKWTSILRFNLQGKCSIISIFRISDTFFRGYQPAWNIFSKMFVRQNTHYLSSSNLRWPHVYRFPIPSYRLIREISGPHKIAVGSSYKKYAWWLLIILKKICIFTDSYTFSTNAENMKLVSQKLTILKVSKVMFRNRRQVHFLAS